jgi:hypothetical protein
VAFVTALGLPAPPLSKLGRHMITSREGSTITCLLEVVSGARGSSPQCAALAKKLRGTARCPRQQRGELVGHILVAD